MQKPLDTTHEPPSPPSWFNHVVRFALNPSSATRITQFLLARDDWLRQHDSMVDPPIPAWLLPTPDTQECLTRAWPTVKVAPLQYIELFGETALAHQVSRVARRIPQQPQHVVLCLPPHPITGQGSSPFAVVLSPTIEVPIHAPMYLNRDLLPRPEFALLPEFPENRPNMLLSGTNVRFPLYNPDKPLMFYGNDGEWLPFPLYYTPSQVELAAVPRWLLQRYRTAVAKAGILKLHMVRCRWCQTHVTMDMFPLETRSKIWAKPGFTPICRICQGPDPRRPVIQSGDETLFENSDQILTVVHITQHPSPKWSGLLRCRTLTGSEGDHLPLMGSG